MRTFVFCICAAVCAILLPCLVTFCINGRNPASEEQLSHIKTGRDVLIQTGDGNYLIDVEQYVAGILPGLVDASADDSYLQAQAVAIRTRVYYAMGEATVISADQMDFQYYTEADYIAKWGKNKYKSIKERYEQAVISTCGKIIE